MGEQAASIIDVARQAGVSVATASRVMSGSSYPVSERSRHRVLEAAAALNYTPNSLARGLRMQSSRLIAVMVGDNTDPYFAEIARGVEEVAQEHGYLTIICNTGRDAQKEQDYLRSLQDYRIDGILFAGGGLDLPDHAARLEELAGQMRRWGGEIVALSPHTLRVPAILADNPGGAQQMTARLLELGHRKIVFVAGPANLLVAQARLQGYQRALSEAGYGEDAQLIVAGNFARAGGEQAVEEILSMPGGSRPTAIFAANDETAFGVLQGLTRRGLRVPGDFSVCGFGDLPAAQLLTPALTSVHIPLRQLGRACARCLFKLREKQEVASQEILPTTIIERDTTAPLAASER